jgi:hypothetical protein
LTNKLFVVMPSLVPGIHVFRATSEDVNGRDKPGHDGLSGSDRPEGASEHVVGDKCRARDRPVGSRSPFRWVMHAGEPMSDCALDERAPARACHAGLESGIVDANFAAPRQQFIQPGMRCQIDARQGCLPSPFNQLC